MGDAGNTQKDYSSFMALAMPLWLLSSLPKDVMPLAEMVLKVGLGNVMEVKSVGGY